MKAGYTLLLLLILPSCSANTLEKAQQELDSIKHTYNFTNVLNQLVDEHEFEPDVLTRAYFSCKSKQLEEDYLLSCLIASIFRENILHKHKLLLCFKEYIMETSIDCTINCFQHYTPECLRCLGRLLPRFFECLDDAPYDYME